MLFRTMTDGVGLDDYYNNIIVDCWYCLGRWRMVPVLMLLQQYCCWGCWCCLGRWRMVSVLMIITSPVMTERVRKRPEAAPGMRLGWTWVFQGFPSNAFRMGFKHGILIFCVCNLNSTQLNWPQQSHSPLGPWATEVTPSCSGMAGCRKRLVPKDLRTWSLHWI